MYGRRYGLCATGDAAVKDGCDILAEAGAGGQTDDSACGWKLACNAAHLLGQTASTNETATLALATLGIAMATARAEIEQHAIIIQKQQQPSGHDYFAMERRRLLAEGCCAAGLIGHRAAIRDEKSVAVAALELLLPVLCAPEPAEALPSFMWPSSVLNNAGVALLRLCSDPRVAALSNPIAPVFRENNKYSTRMLAGSIKEALRRAKLLAAPSEAGSLSLVTRRALQVCSCPGHS